MKIVKDMLNILANFIAVALWYDNQTDLLTFSVCIKFLAAFTQNRKAEKKFLKLNKIVLKNLKRS